VRIRDTLALAALHVAGSGVVACTSSGTLKELAPGDGGGSDGTVMTDGPSAAPDAGDGAPDAAAADLDAASAEASCAVDAGPLDDAQVALGAQIVASHKCTSCHGGALAGNFNGVPSPTAVGGTAYPPNLTSDPATGLGCWTNAEIENAFLNGIDDQGRQLCPPMPRFGHFTDGGGIDPTQAHAVVQYLRSLPIISQDNPMTPDCPQAADAEAEAAPAADAGADVAADAGADVAADVGADAAADGHE
jgi:hypothetical protein